MRVSDRLIELAAMGRMALYTDIDGTLSPIALTPDSATVYPGAAQALREIADRGIRVVAISGRSSDDSARLLGVEGIDYAGNHGFELLTRDGRVVSEDVTRAAVAVQNALRDLEGHADNLPIGVLVENKVYTASVHFRLAPDPLAAEITIRSLLEGLSDRHGLLVTGGRMVFELRPRLDINKGVFATNDIRLHGIRTAAFLGDDLTDGDGFKALHQLAADGELLAAAAIAVRAPESPQVILDQADLIVDGVSGMVGELRSFADALKEWSAP